MSFFSSGCINEFLTVLATYLTCWALKKRLVFPLKLKRFFKMTKEKDVCKKIMYKYLEHPNRSYNSITKELQLKKKVQEPAVKSCTTILFLEISVFLKTMKVTSSTIINKFQGLSIIFPNIGEKQIRNLNSQSII